MTRWLAALLLALCVGSAQAVTEPGAVTVRQSGSLLKTDCDYLDFLATGFTATRSGAGCQVATSSSVTLAGSCIGDASSDWCGTVDLSLGSPTVIAPIINGDDAASGTLTLQSTTHATRGTVDIDDPVRIAVDAPTITATTNMINLLPNGLTLNGAGISFRGVFLGGTITYEQDPSAIGSGSLFNASPTIVNPDGEARAMGPVTVLGSNVTVTPNASDNITGLSLYAVNHAPTLSGSAGAHTLTASYGLRTAGTINSNWTITDWAGVRMVDPTDSGSATLTRLGAIEIDNLTQGTTNYSLWSKGASVFMAHEGNAWFGNDQASLSADPGIPVRVTQQTVGNEIFRAESVATNDDPNYRVYQYRATTAGAVTNTVVGTFSTATSNVYLAEARYVARCTASCGTVGTGAAGTIVGKFRNVGGTLTRIGTDATPVTFEEDTDGTVSINLNPTSADLQMRVTTSGDADIALVWHVTLLIQNVGT